MPIREDFMPLVEILLETKTIFVTGIRSFQKFTKFWGLENWNSKTESRLEPWLSSEFIKTKNWFSLTVFAWMSETLLKLRSHWWASWAPLTDQTSTPPLIVKAAKYLWLFSNTTFLATWLRTIAWENWRFDSFQKVRTLVLSDEWRIATCLSSYFLQFVSLRFTPEII